MKEERIWTGEPAQAANLGFYFACGLTFFLVVPALLALWRWLETRNIHYELTTERFRVTSGVLTRRTEEIELFRIKDTSVVEPFLLRFFALGNVELVAADPTIPEFEIEAIPDADKVRELIRTHVLQCRERRKVREMDFVDLTGM